MGEKFDVIIIGAGMAGIAAMRQIRETNATCTILVLNSEDKMLYKLPTLSTHILSSFEKESVALMTPESYSKLRIDLRHNCRVLSVDKSSKEIELDSGDRLGYGTLILATGSIPCRPEVPCNGFDQVAVMHTVADSEKIIGKMPSLNKVLVYGSSVQGVELVERFNRCGKQVTLVGLDSYLMQKYLNITSARTLKEVMEQNRITVYLQTTIEKIDQVENDKLQVRFSNGLQETYDFVAFAVGIRPHIELAKSAGLDTNRGVVVNTQMQTSDPHIFAAGACAEVSNHTVHELWQDAEAQGKVAALNASGDTCLYEPQMSPLKCEPFHGFIFSLCKPDVAEGLIRLEERMGNEIYQGFYFKDDQLVGCVMTGDKPRVEKYVKAVRENWSKDKVYNQFSLYPY